MHFEVTRPRSQENGESRWRRLRTWTASVARRKMSDLGRMQALRRQHRVLLLGLTAALLATAGAQGAETRASAGLAVTKPGRVVAITATKPARLILLDARTLKPARPGWSLTLARSPHSVALKDRQFKAAWAGAGRIALWGEDGLGTIDTRTWTTHAIAPGVTGAVATRYGIAGDGRPRWPRRLSAGRKPPSAPARGQSGEHGPRRRDLPLCRHSSSLCDRPPHRQVRRSAQDERRAHRGKLVTLP